MSPADARADNVLPLRGSAAGREHEAAMRIAEAMLFAAPAPLGAATLAERLPPGADVSAILRDLERHYAPRGLTLARVAGGWAFRTAADLAPLLAPAAPRPARLSRAALELLAIVAYHQPVTRAEMEEMRGVATSRGTLDVLLQAGWIRPRGRRATPGRPVTYATTAAFLDQFGLDTLDALPGLDDLKALGLGDDGAAGPPSAPDVMPMDDPEDGPEPDLSFSPEVEEGG